LSKAQLCPIIGRLSLAWPQLQKSAKCSTAAFPKLFAFRERSWNTGFSSYNVTPLPRTVAPPPCLPLDITDSLKEDVRFFDGGLMEGFFNGDF
jgi:hypothetical protein